MTRDEIKKIVYDCLYEQYYKDDLYVKLSSKPNDGEDELVYKELEFDSLDIIEFILNIERSIGNLFVFEDDFINNEVTLRSIIDYIDNKLNGEG